ncbi:MAG: RNA polymerase sigma factor [Clostridia bacterium]|nr:RNA polymerase sigma factor [Clostridia bacterium]
MDFETVYTRYFRKVYAFAYSLSGDVHLAEEITQETFFRAMKHPEQFEGRSSVDTYLCSIAHNWYISYLRSRKKTAPEEAMDTVPSGEDIEADYAQRDITRRLHVLLHGLEEPYKEVFTLRVFGELPFAEIGPLFGKGEGWARVTFFRARQKLQEKMKEENDHE